MMSWLWFACGFIYAEHSKGWLRRQTHLLRRRGKPKDLWRVPDSDHIGGPRARPQEYEQRVTAFFNRALLST